MAKEKPKKSNVFKKKRENKTLPCPKCQAPVIYRGAGEDCYSGECGDCSIEIEAVWTKDMTTPTYEIYPMFNPADVPTDYSEFFPLD